MDLPIGKHEGLVWYSSPRGRKIECMISLEFHTINNEAEYEALIAGLDLQEQQRLRIWSYTTTLKS